MSPQEWQRHWQSVYGTKAENEVSWFQDRPAVSFDLIALEAPPPEANIIDVGGGASRLVDELIDHGFKCVTVLDVAAAALEISKSRLGERAVGVEWICADITRWTPPRVYDIWHDRAVFHFLTGAEDRAAYKKTLRTALRPGGTAIVASFDLDGPERCSGLPVQRYSPQSLSEELGKDFALIGSVGHEHRTPFNSIQKFQFSRFRRL